VFAVSASAPAVSAVAALSDRVAEVDQVGTLAARDPELLGAEPFDVQLAGSLD